MDAFQVAIVANMTWWSVALAFAFWLYWQRGRIQAPVAVQYNTVKDEITVEALSGNVHKTILQYRAAGYEPTGIVSRGSIQRITLFKNVRIPIGAR
jgi:hypothetical protein